MRCEQARDLLTQRWLGEIAPADDQGLARHLTECALCQAHAVTQLQVDRRLAVLEQATLASQRRAIFKRLPSRRTRRALMRVAGTVAGMAAAAAVTFFAMTNLEVRVNDQRPPTAPVGERLVHQRPQELPADFLINLKPGAGFVSTAAVPTMNGNAVAYYYLEPAEGDGMRAAILLRRPDGRLTREIDLGVVSFGRLPFTQPEFRLLKVGEVLLLAIATDDGAGAGQLRVAAYNPVLQQLILLPFGESGSGSLAAVTAWPSATDGGIRTQADGWQVDWLLTSGFTFQRQAEVYKDPPTPVGDVLAQTELNTANGKLMAKLEGTLTEGAWLALYGSGGQLLQRIDLGKPHYGNLPMTQPALHKLRVGEHEVLSILSDPMVGQPRQAVVRVFAYDPARGRLRLTPFATGEVLVEAPLAASGDLLMAAGQQWRLSDHWLLEPVR